MKKKTMTFYGKKITLERAALARNPGEEPPLMLPATQLDMSCPLGKFDAHNARVEPCQSAIQLVLDFAPSAFLCPYCCGLFFIDQTGSAAKHPYADVTASLDNGKTIFGYATYPVHKAQSELHNLIQRFTVGKGVLLATRLDQALAQMLQLSAGKIAIIPAVCLESELEKMLLPSSVMAQAICQMATTAHQEGRFGETVALAERALVVEPKWSEAHFLAGAATLKLGMLERATSEYQAALQLNPDHLQAHVSLANIYFEQRQWKEAMHEYQAAIRINPQYFNARFNLGAAYARQGKVQDSIREYQAAARIDPNNAEAHYCLGVMYKLDGRLEDAVRSLKVGAKLGSQRAQKLLMEIQ